MATDEKSLARYKIYALSSSSSPDEYKYIGYTGKALKTRLCEHVSSSKTQKSIKDRWIQKELKLNNKIIICLLDDSEDVGDIKAKEITYISLFKSVGARLKNGTTGGDGNHGYKQSQKLKDWNTETKSKVMYIFNYNTGEFIEEVKNISGFCRERGMTYSSVGYILSGEKLSYKGLWFSYKKDFSPRDKKKKIAWNTGISTRGRQKFRVTTIILEKDGIKNTFSSTTEAAKFIGCNHTAICQAKKRGTNKVLGYKII